MREVVFFLFFTSLFIGKSQNTNDQFYQIRDQILTLGSYHDPFVLDSLYRKSFALGQNQELLGEDLAQLLVMYGARHIGIIPNLDTCFYYLSKAEELSKAKKYYRSLAKSEVYLAHYFNILGKQKESVDYLQKAKKNAELVRDEKVRGSLIPFIFSLSGDIFKSFNLYDSALQNYQKAIQVASASNILKVELKALNQLGSLYMAYGEYDLARALYGLVMDRAKLDNVGSYSASAVHNLADIYLLQEELDSALMYYQMAFSLRSGQKRRSLVTITSLAKIHARLDRPDSGFYYLSLLDTTNLTSVDRHHLLSAYSQVFLAEGDTDNALLYNASDITFSRERGDLTWLIESLRNQVKIYKKSKRPEQALASFEDLKQMEDSLLNIEKAKSLFELRTRYETQQKEQQIAKLAQANEIQNLQLSQQRIILAATIAVLVLILFLITLLFNQRATKSKQKQLALEQNLLRAQMNPHFIFNALASIQGLITRDSRKEAATYLAKFGELTRDILEASRKELVSLSKEVDMIRNYVDLEQARFSKSLELEVSMNDIDDDQILIPPMMIQPFLENSIRHGFKGKDQGKITIEMRRMDQMLNVSIIDDGHGLKKETKDLEKSLATKIVTERLQHLKGYSKRLLFNIYNRRDEKGKILGVQVVLNLPLNYAD